MESKARKDVVWAICAAVVLLSAIPAGSAPVYRVLEGINRDNGPTSLPLEARRDDLLAGLLPVYSEAGLHPHAADLLNLTDGDAVRNGLGMADAARKSGGSSTTLTFLLPKPKDIGTIRVFSTAWRNWGNHRTFQDYDVEISTDISGRFTPLITNVCTCCGREKVREPEKGAHSFFVTVIENQAGDALAKDVHQIRFTFWNPRTPGQVLRSSGRDGTIISEIDLLPYVRANVDADAQ